MRGNQKNKNYKVEWTPEFAYAIGLLTSDGNLSKDGRHLTVVSKDKQLLSTFKNCLNLECKIARHKGGPLTVSDCYRVQFSNAILFRYLLTIGLHPNKSKTIGRLKIPNKCFFDFLRGHFDGDGSCYSFWDKRWPNSYMFYTHFCSASLEHLQWIHQKIKTLTRIKGGNISTSKSARVWQLQYCKKDSQIIWKKMYYKKFLPCLTRKLNKINKILKTQAQVA